MALISWDGIISTIILLWIFIVGASRITRQSVPEMLTGIKEFVTDTKDEANERGEELIYYNQ